MIKVPLSQKPKGLEETGAHVVVSVHDYQSNWGDRYAITCSCGCEFPGRINIDGRANKRLRESWSGHVSADEEAATVDIGWVTQTRVKKHYIVLTVEQALANNFHYRWKVRQIAWCLCEETYSVSTGDLLSRSIVSFHASKNKAVVKGRNELDIAEAAGHRIERVFEAEEIESVKGTTFRIITCIDKALETGTLSDIETAMDEIREFDLMSEIIDSKRDTLINLRNKTLNV